jgi:hypothetical protein
MRKLMMFAAAGLLGLSAWACDDVTGGDDGRVTILLTDAPGDLLEAVVTISSIYLQGDSDDDEQSGRVYLRTDPVTTDLQTLTDDVATLVEDADVPEGRYGQLRFVISGAYIRIDDNAGGKVYATAGYDEAPDDVAGTLMCPSCGTSGLKVTFPGSLTVNGDEDQAFLVDFDVAQSVGHEAGNSGKWIMHPSLKGSRVEEDDL